MIKTSPILFTAILSYLLVGKRLFRQHYLGMIAIAIGVILVGAEAVMNDNEANHASVSVILILLVS